MASDRALFCGKSDHLIYFDAVFEIFRLEPVHKLGHVANEFLIMMLSESKLLNHVVSRHNRLNQKPIHVRNEHQLLRSQVCEQISCNIACL